MERNERKYWFPAKKYGYGWGPPHCWQGWVFLLVWLAVLYGGVWFLRPDHHPVLFFVHMAVMVTVLIVTCVIKGEKPGWRWGDKK